MRVYTRTPLAVRLWTKVKITADPNKCWEWSGRIDHVGRGRIVSEDQTKKILASRAAYEVVNGEIKDGLQVLHTCDNPTCCNPNHLWLGTAKDNMRDKTEKGRHHQTLKTHCPKGHPYDDINTYLWRGNRRCSTCMRGWSVAYELKLKQLRREKRNKLAQ